MGILRSLLALISVVINFIVLSPWMLYYCRLTDKGDEKSLKKRDKTAPKIIRYMCGWVMRFSGARVNIHGRENIPDEPCVLVGNHQSYFDVLSLLSNVKPMYGYMAKSEIGNIPFLHSWMKTIDCVFLDRGNAKKGIEAIREAVKLVSRGRSIYIFPEGTRSKSDQIGEFKQGAMMIATKAGVPVVPFLIDGTYKIFEANGIALKPAEVNITFLPPVRTDSLSREEIRNLSDTIRNMIIDEQTASFKNKQLTH